MITVETLYEDIVATFGNLWSFKKREKSIEIITPFATTNHRFISVFLTIQGNEYIVSDGGWINQGVYENNFNLDEDCYKKIILYYEDVFKIKETIKKMEDKPANRTEQALIESLKNKTKN